MEKQIDKIPKVPESNAVRRNVSSLLRLFIAGILFVALAITTVLEVKAAAFAPIEPAVVSQIFLPQIGGKTGGYRLPQPQQQRNQQTFRQQPRGPQRSLPRSSQPQYGSRRYQLPVVTRNVARAIYKPIKLNLVALKRILRNTNYRFLTPAARISVRRTLLTSTYATPLRPKFTTTVASRNYLAPATKQQLVGLKQKFANVAKRVRPATIFPSKINKDLVKRGWDISSVNATITNPHATSPALNKKTGRQATAYYNKDGSYVVRENATSEIVQISNRNDPKWVPDSSITKPYRP